MQDDPDVPVGNAVDLVAEVVKAGVGDEGNLLADGDAGLLAVPGENRRPRQHFELSGFSNGPQRRLKVAAENLIQTRASHRSVGC